MSNLVSGDRQSHDYQDRMDEGEEDEYYQQYQDIKSPIDEHGESR